MLVLRQEEVERLLPMEECISAMEKRCRRWRAAR